jgi:Ca-activated chloride channel family protein
MIFDRFQWPAVLLLLALVPVVLLVSRARAPGGAVLHPGVPLARLAGVSLRARLAFLPRALRALALALLIVALARPQDVLGTVRTKTEGVAIQLVIDRSSSMNETINFEGRPMTRFETVKRVASEFIAGNGRDLEGRAGDMIGVIAFGSYADTICPLVRDHAALLDLIGRLEISPVRSEQGTAIGDSVALAAARLRDAEREIARSARDATPPDFTIRSKSVILLTDGMNNRGEIAPLQAAELCAEWGIRLYTIGVGEDDSVTIAGMRIARGGGVDTATMSAMAERTGGRFWMAHDGEDLREIHAEIDALEKTRIETTETVDHRERYAPFAAAALALLALETLLGATLLRRSP